MFERVLQRMRELIRSSLYVMTAHGLEEMLADDLGIFDVEHCVLTGTIVERQKDRETGEWKYVVEGRSLAGTQVGVVAKLAAPGKLVFITVYLL